GRRIGHTAAPRRRTDGALGRARSHACSPLGPLNRRISTTSSEHGMTSEVSLDGRVIGLWLTIAGRKLHEERERLPELAADGDHGVNMERGFAAALAALDELADASPGILLEAAGKALVSFVGGASGALWGTALRRAGRVLGTAETFTGRDL